VTPQQATAVAIRLFSAWLGITAIRTVPSLYLAQNGLEARPLAAIVALAVTCAAILILWLFPLLIARKKVSTSIEPPAAATPDLWLAMGCALIGLWVLSSTLPAFLRDGLILFAWTGGEDAVSSDMHWMVFYSVEIAIALWLMLGATGFRKAFWWARTAGY
jgi:hypothetical protein